MASTVIPFRAPNANGGFRADPSLKWGDVDTTNVFMMAQQRAVRRGPRYLTAGML